MFTQEQLRRAFDYSNGYLIDQLTGCVVGGPKNRYWYITINYKTYLGHRLIWKWHYGTDPDRIDHIDGNGFNNKIENLRECTQSQNQGNANWGDMRGIEKHGRKYRVRISGSGWKKELGSFETLEAAIEARNAGHREYFGEFTRV